MRVNLLGLLILGSMVFHGTAWAEMVQGQVVAVNSENRSLTVQKMEDRGDAKEINLSVPQNAELRGGIQALEDVEVGDEIRAEANKPTLGIGSWEARWIEKSSGNSAAAGSRDTQGMDSERNTNSQSAMQSEGGAGTTNTEDNSAGMGAGTYGQ